MHSRVRSLLGGRREIAKNQSTNLIVQVALRDITGRENGASSRIPRVRIVPVDNCARTQVLDTWPQNGRSVARRSPVAIRHHHDKRRNGRVVTLLTSVRRFRKIGGASPDLGATEQ